MKAQITRGFVGVAAVIAVAIAIGACKGSSHRRGGNGHQVVGIAPHAAQADTAVLQWLALVDAGKGDSGLAMTSPTFRAKVTPADWATQLAKVRTPLGAVVRRTMTTARPMTQLPGGAAGEYVGMQFTTDFASKTGAVETVAAVHDADGHWRVTRYSIH